MVLYFYRQYKINVKKGVSKLKTTFLKGGNIFKLLSVLLLMFFCVLLLFPISEAERIADNHDMLVELSKYFFVIIYVGLSLILLSSMCFFFKLTSKSGALLFVATAIYLAIFYAVAEYMPNANATWILAIGFVMTGIYFFFVFKLFLKNNK